MNFTVGHNQMSTFGQADRGIWGVYNLGMGTISTMGSSTLMMFMKSYVRSATKVVRV